MRKKDDNTKKGKQIMTIVLIIISLFIAINFGRIYYQNAQVPTLGVSNGLLTPISKKPNNVSTQTAVADKKVPTLPFKDSTEATMAAIKQAIAQYGDGTADLKKETNDYLYVVFTTPLMKFHDDVEFWLDTENKEVHFRSSSRAGYSDMGLNRKRWEALAELYRAQ